MSAQPRRLRDAHVHLAEHGAALEAIALDGCRSLDDVLSAIAAAAAEHPADAWLDARFLRAEVLAERRMPHAHELDAAAGGRACVVSSFDAHAASGSTRALAAAGIDGTSTAPPGGVIERTRGGAPTGVLLEAAAGVLWQAMPAPTDAELATLLRRALADLAGSGYVEAHDMRCSPRVARALVDLAATGELDGWTLRLYATPDVFDEVAAALAPADPDGPVRTGGLKLFTDGTLNSRTAWMLAPFAEPLADHPRGIRMYEPATLRDLLRGAIERRVDVAAHAIGDAAVRDLLDAWEAIEAERGAEAPAELRIEHAEFVDEVDVERFARPDRVRPIVASMQVCHLLCDVEAIRRLAPHRADRAFALRDLVDAAEAAGRRPEEVIRLGSDTPIVPPDPADSLQAATQRRRPEMPAAEAIAPAQAIDEALCWRLLAPA